MVQPESSAADENSHLYLPPTDFLLRDGAADVSEPAEWCRG